MRPLEKGDLSYLPELANDPAVRESVVGRHWPLSDTDQQSWFSESPGHHTTKRFIIGRLRFKLVEMTRNKTRASRVIDCSRSE